MNAAAVAELSSAYDHDAATITVRLDAREAVAPGWRLAFTSIVQIDPDAPAELVARVSSYHLVGAQKPTALAAGAGWEFRSTRLGHRPRHANDGPVSAYLVRADGAIAPVAVTWLTTTHASSDRPHAEVHSTEPAAAPSLVPYPAEVSIDDPSPAATSRFRLAAAPADAHDAWTAVAALAARMLTESPFETGAGRGEPADGTVGDAVHVTARLDPALGDEAYRLAIDGRAVDVAGAGPAGFRHAFVTLAQWSTTGLPSRATVLDHPRFAWRGVHLDVARQWFSPELVAHMIDVAAWHKLSHFHLHLTDDEGWRLPVARRQRLGEVGGVRGHGLPLPPMYGGGAEPSGRAYTADEIRAWHALATDLGVVIVPEIDLPGHMHAALTAEPELRDPDDRSGASSVQHYVDNVLVPGHPATAAFVEDVFDSVAELFPDSPWIHIGGDEVPAGSWAGSPIADRYRADRGLATVADVEAELVRDVVASIRERHGRAIGAWQEAAECGGVAPGDGYVVGWRTADASRSLAARGFDVVVAPGQAYYLDMATSDDWDAPGASWAGTTTFDDVCRFDPALGWSDEELAHLIGIQACLWAEHVRDDATFDRLMFPRLWAVAERGWTGGIRGGPEGLRARGTALERIAPARPPIR